MVQWLRLHASNAENVGSIPAQGNEILLAAFCSQTKKKKREKKINDSGFSLSVPMINFSILVILTIFF